ncbi:MAG: hypothetical protein MHM6MM_002059 [Cercozoa sp. M6MM]
MGQKSSTRARRERAKARLKAQKTRSAEIDEQAEQLHKQESDKIKILMLGAGESGKSTIFRQLISIYGRAFSRAERKNYTQAVYANTLQSIQTLIQFSDRFASSRVDGDPETRVARELESVKRKVFLMRPNTPINEDTAVKIAQLWQDAGIQRTFERRNEFQLPDSAPYFFGRLEAIGQEDYVPSEQDVLQTRMRSTGITETSLEIDGRQFAMYDVGGQRNERKKWIHCFEKIQCIFFVISLSGYDQKCWEDGKTNRMHEALALFDEVVRNRYLADVPFVVFLNKLDLFLEKFPRSDFRRCFPDFEGCSVKDAVEFIRDQIVARSGGQGDRIQVHLATAVDQAHVSRVFDRIKQGLVFGDLLDSEHDIWEDVPKCNSPFFSAPLLSHSPPISSQPHSLAGMTSQHPDDENESINEEETPVSPVTTSATKRKSVDLDAMSPEELREQLKYTFQ